MSNPNTHLNHEAKLVIADWLSIGSQPIGAVETEVFDNDWLPHLHAGELTAEQSWHASGMHIDRAFRRAREDGVLEGAPVTPEYEADIRAHLQIAGSLLDRAIAKDAGMVGATAELDKLSLSTVRTILLQQNFDPTHSKEISGLSVRLPERLLAAFQHEKVALHVVPRLNTLIGQLLLTRAVVQLQGPMQNRLQVFSAASRHRLAIDSPYNQWHSAVYDISDRFFYPVRFAQEGDADLITIHPLALLNTDFKAWHGRGTLEAMYQFSESVRDFGKKESPRATAHVDEAYKSILRHFLTQEAQVRHPEAITPEPVDNLVEWYATLSPYLSPTYKTYGDNLERAMAHLELKALSEGVAASELFVLASMHLESASSLELSRTSNPEALMGSFDRAQDLYTQVSEIIPGTELGHYNARLYAATAGLQKAIASCAAPEAALDVYCETVAELSAELLEQYRSLPDKRSNVAKQMEGALHMLTVCLLGSYSSEKSYIITQVVPRLRGLTGNRSGWDFAIWVAGHDTYEPAPLAARLEQKVDPHAVDYSLVDLELKMFGQADPKYDFHILEATINEIQGQPQPSLPRTQKHLKTARKYLQRMLGIISGEI